MIAEVPLGAFLSGGVDSSAVVATMAGAVGRRRSTPARSRSTIRRSTSRASRSWSPTATTRAITSDLVESDDFDLIDTLARLYDEPYADSSAIPTYRVCQLARKHVTVALSGDGGDESFGGYRRYRLHLAEERLRAAMPLALRRSLFGLLGRAYPKLDWAPRMFRAKTTFEALARNSVEAYFNSVSTCATPLRSQLYSASLRAELGGYDAREVFDRHARRAGTDDPLALIQYLDLKTYLVGDINTKVDRASMAHSLEVREPLMDHELVEWLASLPSDRSRSAAAKASSCSRRAWKAVSRDEVLYRPKMGFAVPLARWFRGPLRERVRATLHGGALGRVRAVQSAQRCERIGDEHLVGRARPQHADLDAADVRGFPAQRDVRRGCVAAAAPRLREHRRCASCTSSTIRCRCTAATRSGPRRSCASSARWAGRPCSSPRRGRTAAQALVEDVDNLRFHRTPLPDEPLVRHPGRALLHARSPRRRGASTSWPPSSRPTSCIRIRRCSTRCRR